MRPSESEPPTGGESDPSTSISTGATTRRHKHTPSTGSAVTTIAEGDEDDKEHHSSDKDVPVEVLSSAALRASSTSILAKPPVAENPMESEPTKKDVTDVNATDPEVGVKEEEKEKEDEGEEEKKEEGSTKHSAEDPEAETVVHDS